MAKRDQDFYHQPRARKSFSLARFINFRSKASSVWVGTRALSDHQLADIGLSRSQCEFGVLTYADANV